MLTRLFVAAVLALSVGGPASAQVSLARDTSKLMIPFKQVVEKARESTVRVRCDDKNASLGTIVSAQGHILTKASELNGKVTCRLNDGTEYDATILSVHKSTDLALIRIDVDRLTPVTFSDSKKVPAGNWLAAAGTGGDPLAVGIVSVSTRNLKGEQADATLSANRGFLNVIVMAVKDMEGVRITDLIENGAAARAGLRKDDVITEVSGRTINDQKSLRETLDEFRPNDTVTVRVKRGDDELTVKVKLDRDKSPPSREVFQNTMGSELSGRRTGFPSVLQTDMVISPKDCGGPVVDLNGKVLGVSIARAGRVETWILPSEAIRPLLSDMKTGKFPPMTVSKK